MLIPELIGRKRDGLALAPEEWVQLVEAYTAGTVPDYQMSALLMAVVWRGLEPLELEALTGAMLNSGDSLSFGDWDTPRVDKHSTGGVGDKTSLILVPLVAACGVAVPMMSGRGLGHTGGTLDKLESIPGFRTGLTLAEAGAQVRRLGCAMLRQTAEMVPADGKLYALRDVTATVESIPCFRTGLSLAEAGAQVRRLGCAMLRQTAEMVPADGKLYALRDVTATVESIPLICASIMSKKLAEGLTGLVLDVKTGSGAFLPEVDRALELARTMIALGERHGCPTVALLTAMDRPLGRALGNALEVEEILMALEGRGPADLMEVSMALGEEMLMLAGNPSRADARRRLEKGLQSGAAREMFGKLVEAQGGNPRIIEDPSLLPQAKAVEVFRARESGTVARVEPRRLGRAIVELGGGRRAVTDEIDPSVGFVLTVKPGDKVKAGEPIASIFARDAGGIDLGARALSDAIIFGDRVDPLPLVSHRVTAGGVEALA